MPYNAYSFPPAASACEGSHRKCVGFLAASSVVGPRGLRPQAICQKRHKHSQNKNNTGLAQIAGQRLLSGSNRDFHSKGCAKSRNLDQPYTAFV